MAPFALSISVLSLVQGATVALVAPPVIRVPERLRTRRWALLPAASVAFVITAVAAVAQVADALSYLALVAVPALAVAGFAGLARRGSTRVATVVVPLFALAWVDRRGLAGEAAAVALCTMSCITLGALLFALAPRRALKAGVVAMALVDTALVVADLLQGPNRALDAAHPAAGLPQLQRVVFGSAVIGYGDIFVAAVVGAMLAAKWHSQWRGAVLTAALALTFDLLFLLVAELPATVPVAIALLTTDAIERRGERRGELRRPQAVKSTAMS